MLQKLDEHKIDHDYVTLHVGGGTFLPVTADNIKDHIMHSEYAYLPEKTAAHLNHVKQRGGRILCVGTTSMRTLESATTKDGTIKAFDGETDIFITPETKIKACDMLLTNFHLPKSTLLMLVSSMAGTDIIQKAYREAQEKKYRFFSYGDACLLM